MEFKCIFEELEKRELWAVCYPENKKGKRKVHVFEHLFTLWKDTQYLRDYFLKYQDYLKTDYCNHMTISEAIDKVLDERNSFIRQLYAMENNELGQGTLKDAFKPLHRGIYQLQSKNQKQKRAATKMKDPLLRIYAIELSDGSYVVTGGVIKLTEQGMGDEFDKEMERINRVEQYLKSEGIWYKEGLTD